MEDILGAGKTLSKKPQGTGTKVSGYVESPIEKKCGTCTFLYNETLCTQKNVLLDKEVPFARRSKLKKVDAENGCCNYWSPEKEK